MCLEETRFWRGGGEIGSDILLPHLHITREDKYALSYPTESLYYRIALLNLFFSHETVQTHAEKARTLWKSTCRLVTPLAILRYSVR
jgi:hypothetical protein